MNIEIGQIVEGKVVKITNFGAFVQIEGGGDGLVHISEIANRFVKDINEYLRIGDEIKAKVLTIKGDGKIDLSIKQLETPQKVAVKRANTPEFEKMLKNYLKSSDEKQSDLKKRRDSRRF